MKAKRGPNHRLVKNHRSYTVEEIACLFGIHKNTVRAWVKGGLPTSDRRRPMLIMGVDLAAFLQARRAKHKQPCKPGEIYCVRCRAPKVPAGGMVDCQPVSEVVGHLQAICPDCYRIMNRWISMAKLAHFREQVEVAFREAQEQLSNTIQSTVNSDFKQGVSDHAKTQPGK
ncbi:MAG: helix-turn-helix domain-containing protein [Terracidiphilus sp.]|jgi:hypothetical protein